MSYFSDDRKMYVPLSIDTVEARRSNYFFSNVKMMWSFFAFIPIFALITPLIRAEVGIIPIAVVSVVYMIGYVYFLRFFVFEEKRLRKMVRELDENRMSEVDHFWGIDKIGEGEDDDGMIYYSYKGNAKGTTKGLVVMLERGSTVGVPKGHFEDYRRVKENFLRSLHLNHFYPMCIEMQKKPEMQESLIEYAGILSEVDNEYHQRLLKLNLTINSVYAMGADQRYIEYYVIKRDNFNRNFKRILETILEDTFGQSGYIKEARILNKKEVEEFDKTYLMIDTLDSNNVRKAVDVEPFENFAMVHRLLDEEGKEVPIQFLDDLDLDGYTGRSLDKEIESLGKKEERENERRLRLKEEEISKLNKERNRDLMTHNEYIEKKEEIERKYEKETYEKERDKREKREKERKGRKRQVKQEEPKEIKEFDLNKKEKGSFVRGDESIDELVKKEKGSVFNKYKN